jgi:PAS domain-containing protein
MPTFADSYTASPHLSTYTASPALAGYLTSPALSNATTASPAMSSCTDVSPAASVRTVNDLEDEEGIMQWLSNTSRKRRRDQCATAQAALSALGSSANKQKWYRERNKEYSRNWRNKKRQEEESLKNEMEELKSFKQTIESSLDMISLHCGQSFTFAYASPGYSRLVGLEPQGLLGKEIGSIADADTGEILRQACSQAMTNGVPAEVQWMLVLDSQAVAVESSVRHARQGVLVYTRLRG